MIDDLIKGNRSFRRFDQSYTVSRKTLEELVDLARHSASARNLQPLKYFLSCDPQTNALIFDTLTWAAALKWAGPAEGERPSAYIVVLGDTKVATNFGCDHGIASQSIMLGARERGLGGCMLASVNRQKLRSELNIPEQHEILLVLALGKPAETVVIESAKPDGDTTYWRDSQDVHHVPKRTLKEIILNSA
ncbi:MAG: nitroreductase family protein [Dehalococcoidia bacterium]|nr:nitroreductase family protein [Dehalococcoidia bacterium]